MTLIPSKDHEIDSPQKAEPALEHGAAPVCRGRWSIPVGVSPTRRHGMAAAGIALLLVLILFLRRPEDLLNPQFFAEDGALFFHDAWEYGFLKSLAMPTAGYLNLVPRLAAGLARLVPLELAPLITKGVAFMVQTIPLFYLLSRRGDRLAPTLPGKALLAAAYVMVPNSEEVYASLTNVQWLLAPAACLVLLADPPRNRIGWTADMAILGLTAFTGPTSILLAPAAVLILRPWVRQDRDRERSWALMASGILVLGAAVQGGLLLTAPRITGKLAVFSLTPSEVVRILSTHGIFDVLVGVRSFVKFESRVSGLLHAAVLTVPLVLAWLVVRRRHVALLLLLYLATATVALSLLFPSNDLAEWLNPVFGRRYYFYFGLFLVYALIWLVLQDRAARYLGWLLAIPLAVLAIPGDFFHVKLPDSHYKDQLAAFGTLPPGARFFIPTNPFNWGMTLIRKPGASVAPSPLAGLRMIDLVPPTSFQPPVISSAIGFDEPCVWIRGWTKDPLSGRDAGGVWLKIEGKLYPAIYGRSRIFPRTNKPTFDDGTFQRQIPISDLAKGRHQLSIIVMTTDRKSYFKPVGGLGFNLE